MRKGIYVFPSLVTLANLAAGVISIIFSSNGEYTSAAWAIIAGIIMDMTDGRVARWMGATSQFGLELDSLCDLVTFGVAPAILMYQLTLQPLGPEGLMTLGYRVRFVLPVFFVITAALRLARFNLRAQQPGEKPSGFVGLPVPAAAGILASFVLSYELFDNAVITAKTIPILMSRMPVFFKMIPVTMLLLSFLMISPVHYGDFKKLKLARPKSLQSLGLIAAGILLIVTYPQNTIFIIFSLYVASGLWMFAWRTYRSNRDMRLARIMHRRKTDRIDDAEDSSGE